ncbi:MAG: hypothetical protein AAFX87_29850 [Bacteroidota bacterium]
MNNDLSDAIKASLEKRKAGFESFLSERMPILTEFMTDLGYEEPHMVLLDAEQFVDSLDQYLSLQQIEEGDRNWLLTIMGYFIGEWAVQRFDGYWLLNEQRDSRTFLKYVVGGFNRGKENAVVDPFEVAKDFTEEPIGRSLRKYIDELNYELSI